MSDLSAQPRAVFPFGSACPQPGDRVKNASTRRWAAVFSSALVSGMAASSPSVARGALRRVDSLRALFDPQAIVRLLERGELALVESNPDGSAGQVVIFSAIAASPEKIYDAVIDVESYPRFMKSVVGTRIVGREGAALKYEWELDVPVFNLRGVRAIRGRRAELIEMRGVSGNFRESVERLELYPIEGGRRTLAVFYRSIDVRSAGVLIKTMVALEPSIEHGLNLAAGFVHLRDVRRFVEGLPEPRAAAKSGPVPPFRTLAIGPSGIDLDALKRILQRGQLALIESNSDGSLRQVAVLALVDAPKAMLASVVAAPAKYPEFIPNLVEQKVTEESDSALRLEYELEVPLANVEGVSRMTIGEDGSIDVIAVSGDITRGRWRWEFNALTPSATVPVHYAYSDVAEASWFVKALVEKQPLFAHGVVVAASTVALTAMKARAEGHR